mmetsp:Transcript_27119/g.76579  ORF Transcript_27119/g.76579 Transcript_27119/m.76579 type:complete len:219 (-) Transcript_27119:1343-1999(-)
MPGARWRPLGGRALARVRGDLDVPADQPGQARGVRNQRRAGGQLGGCGCGRDGAVAAREACGGGVGAPAVAPRRRPAGRGRAALRRRPGGGPGCGRAPPEHLPRLGQRHRRPLRPGALLPAARPRRRGGPVHGRGVLRREHGAVQGVPAQHVPAGRGQRRAGRRGRVRGRHALVLEHRRLHREDDRLGHTQARACRRQETSGLSSWCCHQCPEEAANE